MNQVIDFLIVGFVFFLFASIYRKQRTERVLFWLTSWLFVVLHFFALLFHPATVSGQAIQSIVSLCALVLCGVCFVLSLSAFCGSAARWAAVACLIGIPWWAGLTMAALPQPWMSGLWVCVCVGEIGAVVFAVAFYRRNWKLLLALLLLIAACSAWMTVSLWHGDVNTLVEAILTQCFGLEAVLFSFERLQFSAGTVTVGLALYAWAAVWVVAEMFSRFAPGVTVHKEIWNLPKYFVAAGMILVLLEEQIHSAKLASEQYRLLFAGNPHPMWMYDRDTLAFLQVNDAAIEHYGYTREDFQQMTLAGCAA